MFVVRDNMKLIKEESKSPTHVIKEWLAFYEDELKPRQGLEFTNLEECEEFYKSYAHHVGLMFLNHLSIRVKKVCTSIGILFTLNKDSNELRPTSSLIVK